jgi:hypothetical protein
MAVYARILACLAFLLFGFGAKADPLLGFYDNETQTNTPEKEAWLNRPIMFTWNYGTPKFFTGAAPRWHMQPMVDWLNARPGRQLVYTLGMFRNSSPGQSQTLAACAAGSYDADYIKVAKAFEQYGITSNIFRIGHEFSGNWYSWRAAGHEADYAACYRHIVQVLRATVPGNHWTFDWNPVADTKAATLNATYPGDDVVDYVTVDIYDTSRNVATAFPYPTPCDDSCRLARQKANWNNILYQMNQIRKFAQSHGKKFAIPEWAIWLETGESGTVGGGDDPYFIQQMHDYIANPANNVAYSVYFETSAQPKICCSAATSQFPNSSALFQKLFGNLASDTSKRRG